jgi:hypothetical protein
MHVTLTPNLELASVGTIDADALFNRTAITSNRTKSKPHLQSRTSGLLTGAKLVFPLRSLSWYYIRAQDAAIWNLNRDIAMEIKQPVTADDGM